MNVYFDSLRMSSGHHIVMLIKSNLVVLEDEPPSKAVFDTMEYDFRVQLCQRKLFKILRKKKTV